MYTNDYNFTSINAVKIILKNPENKVLLIQELATNEWMPLHWGLPGGKPTKTESLSETLFRKIKTDIGHDIKVKGIYRVYEILMSNRTVHMYIVVAETPTTEVSNGDSSYKWVNRDDIEKIHRNEFTEFFNKRLLLDFFDSPEVKVSMDIFDTQEFYKLENDPEYRSWFDSGKKA